MDQALTKRRNRRNRRNDGRNLGSLSTFVSVIEETFYLNLAPNCESCF